MDISGVLAGSPFRSAAGSGLCVAPDFGGRCLQCCQSNGYEKRANPDKRQQAYYQKDLQDWAQYRGIRIGLPPVFPVRAVDAMRGAIVALNQGKIGPYAAAVFESYWTDLRDISLEEVLGDICDQVGLDRAHFFESIVKDEVKSQLRDNTQDLIDRGGFGSPTFFVDDTNMFFGNDRVPLIEKMLGLSAEF